MYGQTASSRNENNHRATATDPAATNTELGSDSDKALPITTRVVLLKMGFQSRYRYSVAKGGFRDAVHRRSFC